MVQGLLLTALIWKAQLPSPEMVKNKTINDIDRDWLGFDQKPSTRAFDNIESSKGLAACKQPKALPKTRPPNKTPAEWRDVKRRWVQREREFRDLATKIDDNPNLNWDKKTGIITDRRTGKPFTGDNDAFSFVDATTGKPVSPYTNQKIVQELKELGVIQHGEHANWDVNSSSNIPTPKGGRTPLQTNRGIDKKILGSHVEGGKEPLNAFYPSGNQPLRNLTEDQLRNLNIDPEWLIASGVRTN